MPRKRNKKKTDDLGDVDGLSVSRQAITSAERVSVSPTDKKYHVARLTAGTIYDAQVSIRPDPQKHDEGHCLLPELNITDYLASAERRRWIEEKADLLARASEIILKAV
jgi:hypothetical protein